MTDPAAGPGPSGSGPSGCGRAGAPALDEDAPESATFGESWEQLAGGLIGELQGWLVRTSARGMRDELRDQVSRAFGGSRRGTPEDVWATATTEPPEAAAEPPECAWCPICRAARQLSRAAAERGSSGSGEEADGSGQDAGGSDGARAGVTAAGMTAWFREASGMMSAAASQVLEGLDAVLSFRPARADGGHPESDERQTERDHSEERVDEPDDRS